MTPPSIWLFAKKGDPLADQAGDFVKTHFPVSRVVALGRGDALPVVEGACDVLVSYLCPKVLPASLLSMARRDAINFHPGPPEYPGIGCTNFAVYDEAREYGVTCHRMAPRVDSGPIVRVDRFPVYAADTVLSLTRRCYVHIARLFYEAMDDLLAGRPLPASSETWKRAAYTRAEFNGLFRLTPGMSEREIRRRVRATTFPGHPAASFGEAAPS